MTRDLRDIPRSWWGKCAIAGLIGGLLMAAFLMLSFGMQGRGFWTPINAIGATLPIFRPPAFLSPPPAVYVGAQSLTGLFIHLVASCLWALAYGVIIAAFVPRRIRSFAWESLYALGWGAMLWVFSGLQLFTRALSPVAVQVLTPTVEFFLAHFIYALATAWILAAWTRPRDLTVVFAREEAPALAARRRP